MTALVVGLAAAVALLGFLVVGLLRANADVIRALHQMGANLGPDAPGRRLPGSASIAVTACPTPARPDVTDLVDLAGTSPRGDAISLAVSDVGHDTLVAFLTSGCQACRGFWERFREVPADVPGAARLVVVTRGPEAESPGTIAGLSEKSGGDGLVPVVMSTDVWEHYDIPYAPYFLYISGPDGRVVGEGAAAEWDEVRSLVANAVADGTTSSAEPSVGRPPIVRRPRAGRRCRPATRRGRHTPGRPPPISDDDPRSGPKPVTSALKPLAAFGLQVMPASGWDIAIYRRAPNRGERTYPVLHAATVALPTVRGDYGSGLVELLGPEDVFVSVLEFGPESVGSPLCASWRGVPGLTPDMYRPQQLQRTLLGQAGVQRFFSTSGRAFCLYSVVGSMASRVVLTARANQLIGSLQVQTP